MSNPLTIALIAGAVVGGGLGLMMYMAKKKKAAATEAPKPAEAAAGAPGAPATPVGAPIVIGPDGKQVPVDPATNAPAPGSAAPAVPTSPTMGASSRISAKYAGNRTLAKLAAQSAQASQTPRDTKSYKLGDSGDRIKYTQRVLKRLGYYKGPITGKLDASTEASIKKFQTSRGIPATGISTDALRTMLWKDLVADAKEPGSMRAK